MFLIARIMRSIIIMDLVLGERAEDAEDAERAEDADPVVGGNIKKHCGINDVKRR